jgi:DNA polymerase-3 subunit gamma/tau
VRYERAVALLGYTHGALLDEVVTAFAAHDAAAAFAAIDRSCRPVRIRAGSSTTCSSACATSSSWPRRARAPGGAARHPRRRARADGPSGLAFGTDRLSRIADLVVGTLDDMSGATSPRLQLELLVARVLAHTADAVAAPAPAVAAPLRLSPPAPALPPRPGCAAPAPVVAAPAAPAPRRRRLRSLSERAQRRVELPGPRLSTIPSPRRIARARPGRAERSVTLAQVRDAWPEILQRLEPVSRSSWMLAVDATPVAFADDVLTLSFRTQADVAAFKKLAAGKGPAKTCAVRSSTFSASA